MWSACFRPQCAGQRRPMSCEHLDPLCERADAGEGERRAGTGSGAGADGGTQSERILPSASLPHRSAGTATQGWEQTGNTEAGVLSR